MERGRVVLIGAPVEEGATRPGCAAGPDALRAAGLGEALAALGYDLRDSGNIRRQTVPDLAHPNPAIRNLAEIAGWTRSLFDCALDAGMGDDLPIYLGGDHALALGTVPGHAAAAARRGRPLFVLWLDAHSDFHTLHSTESGNLHGTPLAYVCGLPGFDELLGRPLEHTVPPENVMILGARSIDVAEHGHIRQIGVEVASMHRVAQSGAVGLLDPFLRRVRDADGLLHVSLDIDFLDPKVAPAVGVPEPGGVPLHEAYRIMDLIHASGLLTSLDIVELNPSLDERDRTARLAVELVSALFGLQASGQRAGKTIRTAS